MSENVQDEGSRTRQIKILKRKKEFIENSSIHLRKVQDRILIDFVKSLTINQIIIYTFVDDNPFR